MGRHSIRVFVSVLALGLLALPAGLAAKGRRGATVVVTRLDGTRVSGELVAVKPDSLLLIGSDGNDETTRLADIATVRLVRRAPLALSALAGFGAGAVAGYLYMKDEADVDTSNIAGTAVVFGAAGALAGLGVGAGIGADAVFRIAGEPAEVVKARLDRLKDLSREGRLRIGPDRTGPVPGQGPAPAAPPAGTLRPSRTPRFRLALGAAFRLVENRSGQTLAGSFLFPDEAPAGEAGPFDMPVTWRPRFSGISDPGLPVSLALEWTDHWLVELELFFPNKNPHFSGLGQASFLSTTDGKTYGGEVYFVNDASFASLLIGPVYRPLPPSPLNRHAVEIGVAAGPARIGIVPADYYDVSLPAGHKIVLSAFAHAAYDFYFVPALSLGVFAGYRYLEAGFPALTVTSQVAFRDLAEPYPYQTDPVIRTTELTIPRLAYSLTGVTFGVRMTFRL